MLNNEPLAIALDLEVTIDMDRLKSKLATDGDILVILRTDGRTANVIVSDHFADMPHVVEHTRSLTGVNGTEVIQEFWIRLNITAKEFYEKLVFKNEPKSDMNFFQTTVKVYVDVIRLDDFHVTIQTAESFIYEGGPTR